MLKRIALLALLALFPLGALLSLPAWAQDEPQLTFMSDAELAPHRDTLARVEKYLSSLTTITSEFTQTAPDGSLAGGKFFLQRPGNMRWQYNPPTPILMVANGSNLAYYDYELEQLSYISLDDTLIGFLAQKEIRFDKGVGIISYSERPGSVRIGVAQRKKPEDGQLVLEFSDKPLQIRNFKVTDASGQETIVSLSNARFGAEIDKKLFDFRDPRQKKR
jgi:outer membrane lipoprotein-sorting protein